ncbi:hypothetical protein ON010_g8372 [Phytophthora cinnamomi]|nr:hypothetical protein ON010_g8372 [Phytophthora cinnamomi]
MSFQYWSMYGDSSCSGVPSGVFALKQASCKSLVQASCDPKYDINDALIGYVKESCYADALSGVSELFDGEQYVAVKYFEDVSCSIYGNTAAYRANGECAALYANQGYYIPVRSAMVGATNVGLVLAINAGNTTDSLNCPGSSVDGYRVYRVSSEANRTHECTTFNQDVVGGFTFYSNIPAADGSGSGITSTADVSSSDFANSGSATVSKTDNSLGSVSSSGTSAPSLVSPTSSSSNTASSSMETSGVSVGLIAGIVAAILVIVAIAFFIAKRNKRYGNSGTQSLQDPFISARTGGTTASDPSTIGAGLWNDDAIIAARVARDQVKIQDVISRGGYGEVYRGTYIHEAVAVKMLFPEGRSDLKKVNAFLAEAKLMAGLSHPHIVRFVGVSWGSLNDLCVLTELMKGGDLRALLKAYDERGHPQGFDSDKIRIAYHVAQALMYLHSLSPVVIHRDLKSKNVLLTQDLTAKLTDFGSSRERRRTR